MRKIKNYLKTGILLIGILTTMTNCQKEDLFNTQTLQQTSKKQNQAITSFQNNFSLDNFKDDFVRNNLIIKWDEFIVTENPDSSLSYEFLTNLNATVSFKNPKNNLNSKYKLIVTISENNYIDFEIVKFLGKNKNLLKDIGLKYLNGFNGATYHYNLNGDLIKSEGFDKGKFVNTMKNKSASLNNVAERAPVEEGWVLVLTERYTDWFFNRGTDYAYSTSHLESRSLEYVYIGSSSGNYNADNVAHEHYPHTPSPSVPVDIHLDEIIADSTFLASKANCALKLLQENTDFQSILDSLIPKNSSYDVLLLVADIPGTPTGSTDPDTDPNIKTITITIDEFHAENSSIVSVALTILHESVHARLLEKVKSLGGLNNLAEFAYLDSEMEQLAAYYNKYDSDNLAHHDFIWDNYVDKLAHGVEQFHKLYPEDYTIFHNYMNGIYGYNKTTFYEKAVKGGLQETSYFKALDSTDQIIISNMSTDLKTLAKKITDQINCE
ncbi:MAG: hypothetical protein ACYC01_14115 [Lutibacter sp.]